MPLKKGNKRKLGKGPKEKEVAVVLHGLPSNLINDTTVVLTKEVYEAIDNAKKPKLNNARDFPIEAPIQRSISALSANDGSTEISLGENTSIYSANDIEAFHRDDTSTHSINGKTTNAPISISSANNYAEEALIKENMSTDLTNSEPTHAPLLEKASIFTIVHTDIENCLSTEATTSAMNTSKANHECPICNKRFNFLSRLQKHMLSHSVDKPYKCNSCSASFVDMHSLNRHSFSHSKNYPYKCEICGNIYINKLDYSNHMLGHNGEDPYKCKVAKLAPTDPEELDIFGRFISAKLKSISDPAMCRRAEKLILNVLHEASENNLTDKSSIS